MNLFFITVFATHAAAQLAGIDSGLFSQVQIISILIGVVLPILVGLVTKEVTSAAVKSVLLLFLSAASSFLTEWAKAGSHYNWQAGVLTWILTFVVAVATQFGFWAPTNTASKIKSALRIRH